MTYTTNHQLSHQFLSPGSSEIGSCSCANREYRISERYHDYSVTSAHALNQVDEILTQCASTSWNGGAAEQFKICIGQVRNVIHNALTHTCKLNASLEGLR